ncbi:Bifunctional oligoribonuclease and PAP phosphatase nrnA [Porphyromonas crevioricanis]|uniref:Bifunctional oligoribonuclease and PAP phosphatase nrnA n=2 Tax=Porphyromonas crevioricanis TaxID=393921 RepID=A0A2X4PQH7_9PORP|nr:Bifunctional oligoribonuclease and PAP phosphatase nrnA [Porphyromonas crevioricanis]
MCANFVYLKPRIKQISKNLQFPLECIMSCNTNLSSQQEDSFSFDTEKFSLLKQRIERSTKICLLSHTAPDGDAVGSVCGLCDALRSAYPEKDVQMILPNAIPRIVADLPLAKEVLIHHNGTTNQEAERVLLDADLICCLDFQSPKRVGNLLAPILTKSKAPKILIDHHLYPEENFFELSFSFPGMSSTAELVYHCLQGMGLASAITPNCAQSLLCGIITDTGCFSYQSESPRVFCVVADLLSCGANKTLLIDQIFHRNTTGQVKLRGYVLDRKLQLIPEIGAAYFVLEREELESFGVSDSDTEGFVNEPLAIEGIYYSFYIRRRETYLKISLRSSGDRPVNDIATKLFGGGGHKNAAGAEYPNPDEAEKVAQMILEEIRNRKKI